jgi:hypothetical protein
MDEHNELISLIFKWVSNNQDINNTFIFIDDLTFDFDRPPKIGNSIPDFYAKNLKSGFEAIGEAKPAYDIYSERTEKQFSDYFRYLKRNPNAILIYATSKGATAQVKQIAYPIIKSLKIEEKRVTYLELCS